MKKTIISLLLTIYVLGVKAQDNDELYRKKDGIYVHAKELNKMNADNGEYGVHFYDSTESANNSIRIVEFIVNSERQRIIRNNPVIIIVDKQECKKPINKPLKHKK